MLTHRLPPLFSLPLVFLQAQMICLQFGNGDLQTVVSESESTSIKWELCVILMLQGREEGWNEPVLPWKKKLKFPSTQVWVAAEAASSQAGI